MDAIVDLTAAAPAGAAGTAPPLAAAAGGAGASPASVAAFGAGPPRLPFPDDWKTNSLFSPAYVAANIGSFAGHDARLLGTAAVGPSLAVHATPDSRVTFAEAYADIFFRMDHHAAWVCTLVGCAHRVVKVSVKTSGTSAFNALQHIRNHHPWLLAPDGAKEKPAAGESLVSHLRAKATAAEKAGVTAALLSLMSARPDLSLRCLTSPAMEQFVADVTGKHIDAISLVGRTALRDAALREQQAQEGALKARVEGIGAVAAVAGLRIAGAVTMDAWSSLSMKPYVVVTYHAISEDWVPHNIVLEFSAFSHPHNGTKYLTLFQSVLEAWGVTAPVVTTDNCTTMESAFNLATTTTRQPCVGHKLNTVWVHAKIADGPTAPKRRAVGGGGAAAAAAAGPPPSMLGNDVKAMNAVITTLTAGSSRLQYWRELRGKVDGAPALDLVPPYSKRWNFEIFAVDRLLKMKGVVASYNVHDTKVCWTRSSLRDQFSGVCSHVLSTVLPSWELVMPLFLRVATWTAVLSSATHPTISLVRYFFEDMESCIEAAEKALAAPLAPVATAPAAGTGIAGPHAAAHAAGATPAAASPAGHPPHAVRQRALALVKCFASAWDAQFTDEWRSIDYINYATLLDPRVVAFHRDTDIRAWLDSLINFAEHHFSGWLTDADLAVPAAADGDDLFADATTTASPWRSERAKYAAALTGLWKQRKVDPAALLRINVYTWWRAAAKEMPLLARAARRLLAPRATSVASEALFSLSGSIASKQRAKMSNDTLRTLTLLGAWNRERAATSAKAYDTTVPEIPMMWSSDTPFIGAPTPEIPYAAAMEATAEDEIEEARDLSAAARAAARAGGGGADEEEEGEGEEGREGVVIAEIDDVTLPLPGLGLR